MLQRKGNIAFTLVEILVSMAVLGMLVLLISQLFNSATMTATMSRTHIDADAAARLVFDRMGSDLAAMVKRTDVNYIFYKQNSTTPSQSGSNDAMYFFSEAPGYLNPGATSTMAATTGSASTMALVGYRINQYNSFYSGIPVMERLGESLTWGGTPDSTMTYPGGPVFLPATLAGSWTATLGTPPYNANTAGIGGNQSDTTHYQVLSDMVFRMEFCFLLKSGTYALSSGTNFVSTSTGYSNLPTALAPAPVLTTGNPTTTNYFAGSSPTDRPGNVYGFPPDLAGIVVTIALLDNTTRKKIPAGSLPGLAAALPDSLSGSITTGTAGVQVNPVSAAQVWQSQLYQSSLAQSVGMPQSALAQVRVYERTFYLDAN